MQTTARFIGRSICGRTRELALDGLATKKDRVIALSLSFAKVIPAVKVVWLVGLKHSKRCAIFVVFTHTTLTEYIYFLTRKVQGIIH